MQDLPACSLRLHKLLVILLIKQAELCKQWTHGAVVPEVLKTKLRKMQDSHASTWAALNLLRVMLAHNKKAVMQAISRAPPWDLGDMLAVMKKDMSSSLHSSADLSRSHARLQAALKTKDRPASLAAAADLASHVSSMLLMLPLPAKSDKGTTCWGMASMD